MTSDAIFEVVRWLEAALNTRGLRAWFIGGIAVQRVVARHVEGAKPFPEFSLASRGLADPLHLASLPRVTTDIDLVTPARDRVEHERLLESQGFLRSERIHPPPIRFVGQGTHVDVLLLDPSRNAERHHASRDVGVALAVLEKWFVEAAAPTSGRQPDDRTATAELLVFLKCVAYGSRHEPRDLVDLARLALVDFEAGEVRRRVLEMASALPSGMLECVRRVRDEFGGADGSGPSAFIASVRNELRVLEDDHALEVEIRDVVRIAVRRLLDVDSEA